MSQGKIYLVGLGPGALDQMTPRAKAAIAAAEVVIGYRTYIRLIAPLLAGKQVVERGMAEEIDRCGEALDLARRGRTVALISSGDVGVFGMAGPLYEVLFEQGWTPDSGIRVEVIPGITAASSCASLAGAPLTHDFCAISLSDMLTPWPVIAARLEAAASSDLVTVLYNPKSSRRPRQIREAQAIFLRHREPATPVAAVHAAYRPRQAVELTTLATMSDGEIGMTTTLIVGNASSFVRAGLMVTPRGYARKYCLSDGSVQAGEAPRVPLSSGLDGWQRGLAECAAQLGIDGAAARMGVSRAQILDALAVFGGGSPGGEPRPDRSGSDEAAGPGAACRSDEWERQPVSGLPAMVLAQALDPAARGALAERVSAALDAYERDLRAGLGPLAGELDPILERARSSFREALGDAGPRGPVGSDRRRA